MIEDGKAGSRIDRNEIFMVFPFMDHDLCGLLANSDFKPTISVHKFFMKQLLEGIAYIHNVCTNTSTLIHADIVSIDSEDVFIGISRLQTS